MGGGPIDFGATPIASRNSRLLAALCSEPFFALRFGELVLLGLDIASLTLKKHAQVIVLATADSDFIPAMKFARREGAQLILLTLGHGVRDGLREDADLVVDWTWRKRGQDLFHGGGLPLLAVAA